MFLWDPFCGRVSGTTLQNRMKWLFLLWFWGSRLISRCLLHPLSLSCSVPMRWYSGATSDFHVWSQKLKSSGHPCSAVFCTAFQVPVAGLSGSAISLRLDGLAKRRACPVCSYNMEWLFLKSNNYIAAHQWVTSGGEKKDSYVSENGHPLWKCALNPSLPLLTLL